MIQSQKKLQREKTTLPKFNMEQILTLFSMSSILRFMRSIFLTVMPLTTMAIDTIKSEEEITRLQENRIPSRGTRILSAKKAMKTKFGGAGT